MVLWLLRFRDRVFECRRFGTGMTKLPNADSKRSRDQRTEDRIKTAGIQLSACSWEREQGRMPVHLSRTTSTGLKDFTPEGCCLPKCRNSFELLDRPSCTHHARHKHIKNLMLSTPGSGYRSHFPVFERISDRFSGHSLRSLLRFPWRGRNRPTGREVDKCA